MVTPRHLDVPASTYRVRFPEEPSRRVLSHLRALPAGVDVMASMRSMARRDALFRRALALGDLVGAAAALACAHFLTRDGDLFIALFLGLPAVVLLGKAFGLYDRDGLVVGKSSLEEAPALFQLATFYTLIIAIIAGPYAGGTLRASTILLVWGLLFLGMLMGRGLARRAARSLTPVENCLLIGDESQARAVQAKFDLEDGVHARICAFLPYGEFELRRKRAGTAASWIKTDPGFAEYVAERGVQRVIIAVSDAPARALEVVRYFKAYNLKVSLLPSIMEAIGSSVEFDDVHGTTLLGVRTFGLDRSSMLLKRAFDAVGSSLLLVFLSPLMAAIAIAIKLDSPGPVFFRQTRVGRKGRRFTMVKFRTMHADAETLRAGLMESNETSGLFKVTADPRVTPVGRFLRRTSLDELPQLWNVLRGDMSLVGPRPLVVEEDELVEGWQRHRLLLKPGMTGAWQIMGRTRVPLEEMAVMDYLYIVNWSIWADTKILFRTARHVFGRRGL